MEKIKSFFVHTVNKIISFYRQSARALKNMIVNESATGTSKKDFNKKGVVTFLSVIGVFFLIIMLIAPTKEERKFREIAINEKILKKENNLTNSSAAKKSQNVWSYSGTPRQVGHQQQPNLNSSMLVHPSGNNAGLQFQRGSRLRVRLADKFSASSNAVPVIATVTEEATTDYGLTISSGSFLYGEAVYSPSIDRAEISFKQLVLPTGEVKQLSARAVALDGKEGLSGNVESNVMQTSFGQVVTGFVGGLAAGSVERDMMGNSKGGLTNGLLNAVGETARNRAEKYGESLKEEKVWIEVSEGAEFDAVLDQPLKMIEQNGGER